MSNNRITDGDERAVTEDALDRNREALVETVRGLSERVSSWTHHRHSRRGQHQHAGHGDMLREQIDEIPAEPEDTTG